MSSCASIFCGSKAKVTFDGEISEEATLTIDGLKHTNVTFPYTTKIRRGFDETVVKIESPNYTASPIIINKNFNAVSVINLLDVLGWGIDAATGAITKPEFKFYYNRGIQMYRFPNSDVQKSVIFEGIKKRLKIV